MDVLAVNFDQVQHWIAAGGYVVLFGLLFLCGLGLPLPEDIPLLAAGAAVEAGHMNIVIASICAWCGIIGGDIMLYHLAKKFGIEITRVPWVGKHFTKERIEKVEGLFVRYGVWVVAVGRLFAGIRGAMVVAAGVTRYNFWKFVIADGIAALVSGGLFVAIGYWLGNTIRNHIDTIDDVKFAIFVAVAGAVAVIVVWLLVKHFRRRKLRATAAPVTETAA
jgi:membrane protein DedA with SNARE-associated domain